MPLTTEQMNMLVTDEMTGKDHRVKGKEADQFLKELQEDIKLAKKNNWQVEIPPEWEVE